VAVPTHSAKKPIVNSMNFTKRGIQTIQKLIFKFGDKKSILEQEIAHSVNMIIFFDESGMVDAGVMGEFCTQILNSSFMDNPNNRVVFLGDHRQCEPVGCGSPFEDLWYSEANPQTIPKSSLTRRYRSVKVDLDNFAALYSNDVHEQAQDFQFTPAEMEKYPSVNFCLLKRGERIQDYLKIAIQYLRDQGCTFTDNDDVFFMTFTNDDCYKYTEFIREILRPEDHLKRRNYCIQKGKTKQRTNDIGTYNEIRQSEKFFAVNDRVCFNKNTRWFQNGDETTIIETHQEHLLVNIEVDYKTHKLIQKVKEYRQTLNPKAKYYDDLPQMCSFQSSYHEPTIDNSPSIGFLNLEEELRANDCEIEDFKWDRTKQLNALRSAYIWQIHVLPSDVKPLTCVTTFKVQGSQCKYGVSILENSGMKSRQMYTQVTRRKDGHILLGNTNTFDSDTIKQKEPRRITVLRCMFDSVTNKPHVEITERICKVSQAKIPGHIRRQVWNQQCGEDNTKGNCYVCEKLIDITNFHCAHKIARFNGGDISMNNLCASCPSCNLKAGVENFDEFRQKYKAQNLDLIACPLCNAQCSVEVSHSINNPNRMYYKCTRPKRVCSKVFVQWVV
jgi:hypothetical protein